MDSEKPKLQNFIGPSTFLSPVLLQEAAMRRIYHTSSRPHVLTMGSDAVSLLQRWLRRTSSVLTTMASTRTPIRVTSTGSAMGVSRSSKLAATDWHSTPLTPSSWRRTATTFTMWTVGTDQAWVSWT